MFCQSCGTQLADAAQACSLCGSQQPSAESTVLRGIGGHVSDSSKDAAGVLMQLLSNPVGGLPSAYAGLGSDRALKAGVALAVAFGLAGSFGVGRAISGASRSLGIFGALAGISQADSGIGSFLKLALQIIVLPAAVAVVSFSIRKLAGVNPSVAADVFTAGAAVSPLGAAMLVAGILGVGNVEIVVGCLFFALTYLVLMLYAGFTRVGGMSERAAAPAVPIAILLSAWLVKVIAVAFF